jgi:hypothetical protein
MFRDQLIIFADGLPSADCMMKDAITIIKNNKIKTIIEMKEKIIDYIVVNSSPWNSGKIQNKMSQIIIIYIRNFI